MGRAESIRVQIIHPKQGKQVIEIFNIMPSSDLQYKVVDIGHKVPRSLLKYVRTTAVLNFCAYVGDQVVYGHQS